MKLGLMKMLLISGSDEAIVDSASLFVEIYLCGITGGGEEADMKAKVSACSYTDSCARAIAIYIGCKLIPLFIYCKFLQGNNAPESLFISSYVNCLSISFGSSSSPSFRCNGS